MEKSEFRKEDEKYSFLWGNGYKPARWKLLAKELYKKTRDMPGTPTVIDFGSGLGNAVEYFSKNGLKPSGVDISRYAVEKLREKGYPCYWSSLDSMAEIADDSFEFGFSNDVIER